MCVQTEWRKQTSLTWKTAKGVRNAFLHACGVYAPECVCVCSWIEHIARTSSLVFPAGSAFRLVGVWLLLAGGSVLTCWRPFLQLV